MPRAGGARGGAAAKFPSPNKKLKK